MEPISLPEWNTPVRDIARSDAVRLLESETVSEALSRLRGGIIGERIIYFYVTDTEGTLVGVVPTRRLLLSGPAKLVGEIMVRPVVSIGETEPVGNAFELLSAKRLLALPVVDSNGRLSGILDLSNLTKTVFDLERRESIEEIFQIAGLHVERERSKALWPIIRNRFPWLLLNICSGILAAFISNIFVDALKGLVALAFFIPLVLTLAESVAMQTVTMSLETIHLTRGRPLPRGRWAFLELRTGLLLGAISGVVVAVLEGIWLGLPALGMTVAGAIAIATTAGAAFGYAVPRLVHRLRLDPKIASGPAVLAITDVAALTSYLGLAALILS